MTESNFDIKSLTIASALEGLRSKKFTATDLLQACLSNVKKYNKKYNVMLTIEDNDKLLHQARQIDATDYSLALSGIPIVLKDLFSSKDLRTTAGSKVLENYVPKYDATVVRKLKEAGAIIIGKVNQDAWGHGSTGENSDYGPTGNAFNPDFVAGGSSSGSAVAVALGMCLAATGTDTGGSIRVPASYNNLIGLKPTYGRVSRYGIIAMASSLDSIGHITKTVEDTAGLLNITAGKDIYDGTTGSQKVPDYLKSLSRKDLKGVKIGVSKEYLELGTKPTPGMSPKQEKVIEVAVEKFTDLGAEIVDISLPYTKAALETYYILVPSEISSNLARYDGIRFGNPRASFGPEAKRRIMTGTYSLSSGYYDAYYKTAQKVRTLVCQDFENAFQRVDLVFAPVTPTPPLRIGEQADDPLALYLSDIYTVPINLAGVPAVSLPAGFVDGLPVGIQLIGPQWSEDFILGVAQMYEKNTELLERKPKI